MVTLEEIARIAHVSRSTVSRVVNQDPNVKERTRQRVLEVIRQLNFQPNRAARSLAGGRAHVLGLVIPQSVSRMFTDPYFPILIQGVSSACNARDYSVMLWLVDKGNEERITAQILNNTLIDGLVITSIMIHDPIVQSLTAGKMPFVLVGRHPLEECACYVDVDNLNSAREAVAYLLRLGRRRVAAITGPLDMYVGLDRRDGYLAALRERGLAIDPALVVEGDFTEEGGYRATVRLLRHDPDAIFAASDSTALGALRAIQEAGLRVPEDIALVGFDDIPLSARSDPPLTTVRQPIHLLGSKAVELLLELIENPAAPHAPVILPTELVMRGSTEASAELELRQAL